MRGRRRLLTLRGPTRDGATECPILAHVPRGQAAAAPLARVYGTRGSIETAFVAITTPRAGEIKTLAYPKAALCPLCVALWAYSAVSVINTALRSHHGRQEVHAEGSIYALSVESSRTYDGMMLAMPAPPWVLLRALSPQEYASALHTLASSVALVTYPKHPRGPKKKPPERALYQHGQHVSTAKLLAQK